MRIRRECGVIVAAAACVLLLGCRTSSESQTESWLSRDPEERLVQLERQLRGLDLAMVETAYRHAELYWAGSDGNWEAAAYHLRKMRLAIENGLERRPKRSASAQPFLAGSLAAMEEVVSARDSQRFGPGFDAFTAACNACHAMEQVPFFEVRVPSVRSSPVEPPDRGVSP